MLVLLLGFACVKSSVPLDTGDDTAETVDGLIPGEDGGTEFGCDPDATDAEVDELDLATLRFACRGATPAESWALISGPDGAEFDPATGTLTWTTDLASSGTWEVEVAAVRGELAEHGKAKIWVNEATGERGNVEPDPMTYTHEYGVPVFHLSMDRDLPSEGNGPVTVTYRGKRFVGTEAQYRGASSSHYPKRSYRVDFTPDDEFKDNDAGFPNRRSIVLTTTFDDNAYFRQKMCFDVWSLLAPARRIVTAFTVLYVNGEYVGLYLLGDHISGEWFEDQGYPEEANLYKSVDHSANFYSTYGGPKSSWHSGYEKKEGVEEDFSDLDAFVEFVATASDAEFDAGIADYVDLEDVHDWWALAIFGSTDDSAGKNAYFYNDPAAPLFRIEPWDFNYSFGQTWQTERKTPDSTDDFGGTNNLFRRLLASDAYGDEIRARLHDALADELSTEEMHALIDSYTALIDRSAEKDWAAWGYEYRTYGGWSWRDDWTDYGEEVDYIREWVEDRANWIERWDP